MHFAQTRLRSRRIAPMAKPPAVPDVSGLRRRPQRSQATLHGVVFEILAGSRDTPPGRWAPPLRRFKRDIQYAAAFRLHHGCCFRVWEVGSEVPRDQRYAAPSPVWMASVQTDVASNTEMAHPTRFERVTFAFGGQRSIQ